MTGSQLQLEDKIRFVEDLASIIVKEKSREDLEKVVWDITYRELLDKDWGDILDFADIYGINYDGM